MTKAVGEVGFELGTEASRSVLNWRPTACRHGPTERQPENKQTSTVDTLHDYRDLTRTPFEFYKVDNLIVS